MVFLERRAQGSSHKMLLGFVSRTSIYIAIVNFGSFGKYAVLDVDFLDTCNVCSEILKEEAGAETAMCLHTIHFGNQNQGLNGR